MNIYQFKLGNAKPEVARSALPTGTRGKTCRKNGEPKKGNYLIGYNLKLVGCL